MHAGECNQLMGVLTVQLLRGPRQPLDGTVEELEQGTLGPDAGHFAFAGGGPAQIV